MQWWHHFGNWEDCYQQDDGQRNRQACILYQQRGWMCKSKIFIWVAIINIFRLPNRLSMVSYPTVEPSCTAAVKKQSNTWTTLALRFQDRLLPKDSLMLFRWTLSTHINDHTALRWSWPRMISWRELVFGWSSPLAVCTSTMDVLQAVDAN